MTNSILCIDESGLINIEQMEDKPGSGHEKIRGDRVSLGKANDAGSADTGTGSASCALLTRQTEDS